MSPPRVAATDDAKNAASKVAFRIADFLVKTEVERLALFRLHLQTTVRQVSPLLLELAVMEGISLAAALAQMYPPQDWPWRPLHDTPSVLVRRSQQQRKGSLGFSSSNDAARFRRAFTNPGVVIREADHPRGRFAIRPSGTVLGFTVALGPCLLSTFGSSALLKLPEPLPDMLMMGLPGRPLAGIVDHPIFADQNYRVIRVGPDVTDGMPVLTFRARLVPFVWPEGDD